MPSTEYEVNDYYNNFDPAKNYEKQLARAGYVIQSAETNEMQDTFLHRIKGIGDALFKDGDIVKGCGISVNDQTGEARLDTGSIYLKGGIRTVPEANFVIPLSGTVAVGVYYKKK